MMIVALKTTERNNSEFSVLNLTQQKFDVQ
jgi:hypothetical protein